MCWGKFLRNIFCLLLCSSSLFGMDALRQIKYKLLECLRIISFDKACARGNAQLARYFIERGAEFDSDVAIHMAATNGQLSLLNVLIEAGADVDWQYYDQYFWNGETPLTSVVEYESIVNVFHKTITNKEAKEYAVQILIESGADLDKVNGNGKTPFFLAVLNGHEYIVKTVIKYNAAQDIKDYETAAWGFPSKRIRKFLNKPLALQKEEELEEQMAELSLNSND